MGKTRKAISGLCLVAALFAVGPTRAIVFDVNVNTSTLDANTTALLAFDLTNIVLGDNHSVRIFGFKTSGTLLNCTSSCPSYVTNPYVTAPPFTSPYLDAPPGLGLISGTLDPGPSLFLNGTDDNVSFISYYQNITVGGADSYIRFRFEIIGTLSADTNFPDGFALTLLTQPAPDPPGIGEPDPPWPSLLNLEGPLFNFSFSDVPDPCVSSTGTECVLVKDTPSVPEPSALVLALAGLLALGVVRSVRNHPLQRETTV